jgi:hypothetical protein
MSKQAARESALIRKIRSLPPEKVAEVEGANQAETRSRIRSTTENEAIGREATPFSSGSPRC